jgi:hypothetical protein
MNKEFIPYEQALVLKELGFDEPCMYYVDKQNNSFIYNFQTHPDEFIEWCSVTVISTPLYQQAFRWFREKYNLLSIIDFNSSKNNGWYYSIITINVNISETDNKCVKRYEEAELACLKKLIEIVKEK